MKEPLNQLHTLRLTTRHQVEQEISSLSNNLTCQLNQSHSQYHLQIPLVKKVLGVSSTKIPIR